jgi:hypothetical protein
MRTSKINADPLALQIQDPSGVFKENRKGASSGDHSFDADRDGRYTYCFSNENSNVGSKEVSFNVHGIVYVAEDPSNSDPLEKGVKELGELLNQVKDEQEYVKPLSSGVEGAERRGARILGQVRRLIHRDLGTLSCERWYTETPPRAPIQGSSGGVSSNWVL